MKARYLVFTGIAFVVLPIPTLMLYNHVGTQSVIDSEMCWQNYAPSSEIELSELKKIAKKCGLNEREDGAREYPDGIRRTYFSRRFTDFQIVVGWDREYLLDVEFTGNTEKVKFKGMRNDGVAWLLIP